MTNFSVRASIAYVNFDLPHAPRTANLHPSPPTSLIYAATLLDLGKLLALNSHFMAEHKTWLPPPVDKIALQKA